jgi:hypothetical protein
VSQLSVNTITNAAGGNTAQINGMTPTADSLQGFRNRIINGNMVIDQRNAGASVTINANQYTADRWQAVQSATGKYSVQQNAGAVTPPAGFTNYLGATSLSAYSPSSSDFFYLRQQIEGYNVADFNLGTASAATFTLSFWVRSSLTGTFGGTFSNGASDSVYPFTYTISAANTWEYKTVTVAGRTSGTWLTTNGTGLYVLFALATGSSFTAAAGSWTSSTVLGATGQTQVLATSGATFYITGVQLEAGSVATPFERIDYGRQLIQCQRYAYRMAGSEGGSWGLFFGAFTSTRGFFTITTPVTMRTNPSITFSGTTINTVALAEVAAVTSLGVFLSRGNQISMDTAVASGLSSGVTYLVSLGDVLLSSEL